MGLRATIGDRVRWLRGKVVDLGSFAKPTQWMYAMFGGGETNSGVTVNEETAMQVATVFACVYAISDDLGKLPIRVYREINDDGDKQRERGHPVEVLLNHRPNPWMTPKVFRMTMSKHRLLWGNAFAEIVFDGAGRPAALYPIEPWRVWIEITVDGRLLYHVSHRTKPEVTLDPEQIFHLKGISHDGITGISVLQAAREAIGTSVASERAASGLFRRGLLPAGVFQTDKKLQEIPLKNLRESLEKMYGGSANAARAMVLDDGLKYTSATMPGKDAQWLESRQFSIPELCRFFRVPPHMVGDLSRSTNNNIEQQSLEYAIYTLLGHCVDWEQEAEAKLFTERERAKFYQIEHDLDVLLRGDAKTRAEVMAKGRQWGYYTSNDCRRMDGKSPLEGLAGSQILVPVNMTTPELIEKQPPGSRPTPPVDAPAGGANDVARGITREFSSLLGADVLARVIAVEADKVQRADKAASMKSLREEWFPQHRRHVASKIDSHLRAWSRSMLRLGIGIPTPDVTALAEKIATRHVDRSLAAIDAKDADAWIEARAKLEADEIGDDLIALLDLCGD